MRAFILALMLLLGTARLAHANYTDADVQCLAQNISYEAPDEPYAGKLAVATVTMNRVASREFPKTVCDVVYQRSKKGCQFSWVCQRPRAIEPTLYAKSLEMARQVLYDGLRLKQIKNSMFFHAVHVNPSWARDMKPIAQIGAHIFYVPIGVS